MRAPTAAWRAIAQGGPHQEAMAISLSGETFTVEAMEIAKTEGCHVVAVHEFFWTDASYAAIRQII
jgi:DNA-binding MurR/RpiR family transcriptional regulator